MVNEGRRSTGCFLCRKRRIRCDEAKPECQRCITYRTKCPGYPEAFLFRSQNNIIERHVQKSQKPSPSTPGGSSQRSVETCSQYTTDQSEEEVALHGLDSSFIGQANHLSLRSHSDPASLIPGNALSTIPSPLSYSSEQQALCFFIHQHIIPPEEPNINGHMAFLPGLLRDRIDSPCLQHAVLGVSYLALGRRTGSQKFHAEARRNYGKSLSSLRSMLSSPRVVEDDAAFATVLLASLFADLSGDREDLRNAHASGIYCMLRHRGPLPRQTPQQQGLFGWGFTQLQIQAVVSATTNPSSELWDHDYMAPPCTNDTAEDIAVETITCKILHFYHRSRQWFAHAQDQTQRNRKPFHDFVHSARLILRDIDTWDSQIPKDWRCAEPDHFSSTSSEYSHASRSRYAASFLALIRACELCFYTSAIGIFTIVDSADVEDEGPGLLTDIMQTMKLRVQVVIQDISRNVSLALGNDLESGVLQQGQAAGAYHILWPLWAVINCPYSSADQVHKGCEVLGRIGSTMGFNLAFLLREKRFPLGLDFGTTINSTGN